MEDYTSLLFKQPYYVVSLTDWFHECSSTIGQLNHFGTSGQLRGSGGNIYRRDAFKDNGIGC